jgi:hypothetical protein
MRKPPSAVSPQELAAAAGRKTRRVQKKLHEAESDLHMHRNAEAERKVHEAAEELEVVKEMLEHAEPAASTIRGAAPGKSGHGIKSLLPHLKTRH